MNKDLATTVLGGLLAAGTAAQPVMASVEGTFHAQNWFQLVTAVLFAAFGYFTNKANKTVVNE